MYYRYVRESCWIVIFPVVQVIYLTCVAQENKAADDGMEMHYVHCDITQLSGDTYQKPKQNNRGK